MLGEYKITYKDYIVVYRIYFLCQLSMWLSYKPL